MGMVDAYQDETWCHTSRVLSMLFNAHRDSDSPALLPDHFHPYRVPPDPATGPTIDSVEELERYL